MHGTHGGPFQVDESYFSGHRKYNRGPLNKGNKASATKGRDWEELKLKWDLGSNDQLDDIADEFEERKKRRNNYGKKMMGLGL